MRNMYLCVFICMQSDRGFLPFSDRESQTHGHTDSLGKNLWVIKLQYKVMNAKQANSGEYGAQRDIMKSKKVQ